MHKIVDNYLHMKRFDEISDMFCFRDDMGHSLNIYRGYERNKL